MNFAKLFYIVCMALIVGCGGQGSGVAPSNEVVSPPIVDDGRNQNLMSYTQTAQSPNGWTASLDSADSVETVVLPSGWTVEVAHD